MSGGLRRIPLIDPTKAAEKLMSERHETFSNPSSGMASGRQERISAI